MPSGSIVKVGPWGGMGGAQPWQFDLGDSRLTGIVVRSDSACIRSIQFMYVDGTGHSYLSKIFGGPGGNDTQTVLLTNETLVEIGGTFGYNYAPHVIMTSVSFYTNLDKYTCGPGGGTSFSLPVTEGKIVGFFGKYGDRLDSFGVTILGVPDHYNAADESA